MAVIAPARPKTGISISPNSLRVAAGKTVAFTVTNDAGTPLEASVDLDPVGLGTLLEGFGTGQWTYSAPSQIAHSATVRIVAKSADKTGEAAFEVMPASVAIDITPKTASVAAGGSVRFAAKATGDLTWLAWPVGTVAADDAGAAYSAPSSVQDVQRVIVLAYSLDSNSTAGIAIAHVTVGSSS